MRKVRCVMITARGACSIQGPKLELDAKKPFSLTSLVRFILEGANRWKVTGCVKVGSLQPLPLVQLIELLTSFQTFSQDNSNHL